MVVPYTGNHLDLFLFYFLRFCLFIFREMGREGEREGEKEKHRLVASHTGSPDPESNQ